MSDKKNRSEKRADATIAAHAAAEVVPTDPNPEPTVTFTVTLPATCLIPVGDEKFAKVPARELTASNAQKVFDYGVGRFTRDGTSKMLEAGADGKKVARDATPDERVTLAEAKWARLVSGAFRTHTGSGDPILGELRKFALKALVKRGVKPKVIGKLPDRAAIEKALAAFDGLYAKCLEHAEKIAAMNTAADL